LPLKRDTAAEPPSLYITSSRSQNVPQFSPDGSKIVFTTNRSGSFEVWVCDPSTVAGPSTALPPFQGATPAQLAIAWALAAMALLFFVVTMVRLGANVAHPLVK